MTCSTFLATRFSLGPGEPVLYAAALRVALGRVADLAHWPSDTFVGLVVGYATGRLEALRVADRRAAAVPAPATRLEAGFPRSPLPLDGVRVTTGRDGGIAIVLGRRF